LLGIGAGGAVGSIGRHAGASLKVISGSLPRAGRVGEGAEACTSFITPP
jgi:hypothetical protein